MTSTRIQTRIFRIPCRRPNLITEAYDNIKRINKKEYLFFFFIVFLVNF